MIQQCIFTGRFCPGQGGASIKRICRRLSATATDTVLQQLSALAEQHMIFEYLRLDYAERFEKLQICYAGGK